MHRRFYRARRSRVGICATILLSSAISSAWWRTCSRSSEASLAAAALAGSGAIAAGPAAMMAPRPAGICPRKLLYALSHGLGAHRHASHVWWCHASPYWYWHCFAPCGPTHAAALLQRHMHSPVVRVGVPCTHQSLRVITGGASGARSADAVSDKRAACSRRDGRVNR